MKKPLKFSRRKLIYGGLMGLPTAAAADSFLLEPEWLAVRRIRLSDQPSLRLAHFTDVHHKGDRKWFEKVIRTINGLKPDVVCFTGDLVEDARHAPEALEIVRQLESPVVGIPGNHDYWAQVDFAAFAKAFEQTGGRWLMDQSWEPPGKGVRFIGLTGGADPMLEPIPGSKNILLTHYPAHVTEMRERKFDLMLAGHSHGGQVRIPFLGALVLPWRVGGYDLGRFDTKWGPLHVSGGIGYFYLKVRFNCRPDVALIEI